MFVVGELHWAHLLVRTHHEHEVSLQRALRLKLIAHDELALVGMIAAQCHEACGIGRDNGEDDVRLKSGAGAELRAARATVDDDEAAQVEVEIVPKTLP